MKQLLKDLKSDLKTAKALLEEEGSLWAESSLINEGKTAFLKKIQSNLKEELINYELSSDDIDNIIDNFTKKLQVLWKGLI
jgi:hypothetical protein